MSRIYKRMDLRILQWMLTEEHRRQKTLGTKDALSVKVVPAYHASLYRRAASNLP